MRQRKLDLELTKEIISFYITGFVFQFFIFMTNV